jgi:hypothetical protein
MFQLDNVDRALRDLEGQIGAPSVRHMPQNTNQGFIYTIQQLSEALRIIKTEMDELKILTSSFGN